MTDQPHPQSTEFAILAGGCFWCLEAVFEKLRGVHRVESGYMGGHIANPTYEQVCGSDTGHAEVVRIEFDPSVIGYRDILEVFFSIHDPTTRNRQGNDVGTQYRSAIFYLDAEQEGMARQVVAELIRQKVFASPIVTEVGPASEFYVAEQYHQRYFENNPYQPYCQYVVAPKVAKFREKWKQRLR